MSLKFQRFSPNQGQLMRTAFWTLWALAVVLTAYALVVESFGLGLFLPDQNVPKLYMRAEARVAFVLSLIAGFGMIGVITFVHAPPRHLKAAALAVFVFWLFYLAIPRF